MTHPAALQKLHRQLRAAFSGELAAALAYRGHWKAVRGAEDRNRIRSIEEQEWDHRNRVGSIMGELGIRSHRGREARSAAMGRAFAGLCRLAGWFLPMYVAGRLERRNVGEYEDAAENARQACQWDMFGELRDMARVEREHEAFFRTRVSTHPWARIFPIWSPPEGQRRRREF